MRKTEILMSKMKAPKSPSKGKGKSCASAGQVTSIDNDSNEVKIGLGNSVNDSNEVDDLSNCSSSSEESEEDSDDEDSYVNDRIMSEKVKLI